MKTFKQYIAENNVVDFGEKKKEKDVGKFAENLSSSTAHDGTKNWEETFMPLTPLKQIKEEFKSPAWQRKEGKDSSGGLNTKGVKSYRRENPRSKLQTAVTIDPSKLKPGSKKAKRRLSFCRRMKGMKQKLTSKETARDPDSRINKSLRKWNC